MSKLRKNGVSWTALWLSAHCSVETGQSLATPHCSRPPPPMDWAGQVERVPFSRLGSQPLWFKTLHPDDTTHQGNVLIWTKMRIGLLHRSAKNASISPVPVRAPVVIQQTGICHQLKYILSQAFCYHKHKMAENAEYVTCKLYEWVTPHHYLWLRSTQHEWNLRLYLGWLYLGQNGYWGTRETVSLVPLLLLQLRPSPLLGNNLSIKC